MFKHFIVILTTTLVASPVFSASEPKIQPVEVRNTVPVVNVDYVPTAAINRLEFFTLDASSLFAHKLIYTNDTESTVLFVGLTVGMDIQDNCDEPYRPGFAKFYVMESATEVSGLLVPLSADSVPGWCSYFGTATGALVVGPGQSLRFNVNKKDSSTEDFFVTARASGHTLP